MGLIGLGGMGKTHLFNSFRIKTVTVVAVADTSEGARQYAKAHGVAEVYDDYTKLLNNPDIDCVAIALPTFLHAQSAVLAAECGKHMLLEKPLARNAREGKLIVSKVQKAGVKAMMGYPLRFSNLARIKHEIDSGRLGEVVTAQATDVWRGPFFHLPIPDWWLDPELSGGGALIDLGPHLINLLLWCFGDKIASVKSQMGYRFNMPFEDHALCMIRFKHGPLATVNVGWYCQQNTISIELFGTMKRLSATLTSTKALPKILHMLRVKPLPESLAFHRELSHFVKCVIDDRDPKPSATEGLRDLEVISAAYKNQIRENQPTNEGTEP